MNKGLSRYLSCFLITPYQIYHLLKIYYLQAYQCGGYRVIFINFFLTLNLSVLLSFSRLYSSGTTGHFCKLCFGPDRSKQLHYICKIIKVLLMSHRSKYPLHSLSSVKDVRRTRWKINNLNPICSNDSNDDEPIRR